MIRCLLFVLAVLLAASAQAQTRRYIISPGPAGTTETTAANAVYNTCYNVLLTIRPQGGFGIKTNGSYESAAVASALGIATAEPGSQFTIDCLAIDSSNLGGNFSATGSITVTQICTAGGSGSLIMQTTIASLDQFGRSVPADVMPNPQCRAGCVIERPSQGQGVDACVGYLGAGVERAVGESLWVACSGDGIAQTGQTCNFPTADQQGITPQGEIPGDVVVDNGNPDNGGTGGLSGDDSANLAAIADNTAAIIDEVSSVGNSISAVVSTLNGLRNDIVSADANADSRHSEAMGVFNAMKTALDGIKANTANGGGSGIPADGFAGTGDLGVLPSVPTVDVPQGGLVSPGESGVAQFTQTLNATGERAAGACPVWNLQLDYFQQSFTINQHCQLFDDNRATLESIMVVVWSVSALAMVLRA